MPPKKTSLLKSIDCAYLPVSSVAASAVWYEHVLGLIPHETARPPKQGAIMVLGDGYWLFLLPAVEARPLQFKTTEWSGGEPVFEMFPLCFETEDIHALFASLKAAGTWTEPAVRDEGSCGLQLHFKDPDGNKFQAFQQPA